MHMFYPHDDEEIIKLCIQSVEEADFIAWHYEKDGSFTVKSVYRLATNLKDNGEVLGNYSDVVNGERRLWDIIWKANVSQKIRISLAPCF